MTAKLKKSVAVGLWNTELLQNMANEPNQKVNTDKGTVCMLDELLRNSYRATESASMKTLRKHLGDEIVFTGVWANASEERELEESELLDGELSGFVFTIGHYTIRSAVCLYQDDDTVHLEERVPAGQDAVAQYQQEGWRMLGAGSGIREVQVISARYNGSGLEGWRHVCSAAISLNWDESINFVVTLKPSSKAPDEQEMLFVLKNRTGDSLGVAHWYKLSSDGTVTEHEEHPYVPESSKES